MQKVGVQPSVSATSKKTFFNLGLFQFLSFVRRGVFYTFMINYIFGLMPAVIYTALLGTLDMLASALGQNLLWGRIADRYNLRAKLVIAGESIAAIAYLIVFQIHKFLIDSQANFSAGLSLILGLAILEFFWSMSDVGWAALLTDVTTAKNRAGIVGALNFIASLGRMIGINFAGFLYNDGEGFRQGTIFYIVIAMLCTSAALMWATSRTVQTQNRKAKEPAREKQTAKPSGKSSTQAYKWFLISLIMLVIGATCVNQVFLLFLRLPNGLNAKDPEVSLILTAWTLSGMLTSLTCGWLASRFGKIKLLFTGFVIAIVTPLLYGLAGDVLIIAAIYGMNGVSFWIMQTIGFAFAADMIPEDRKGRLFSRYNAVIALGWGPAGFLVGAPLADIQTQRLGLSVHAAYINTFYASAIILLLGAILFTLKVARTESKKQLNP